MRSVLTELIQKVESRRHGKDLTNKNKNCWF